MNHRGFLMIKIKTSCILYRYSGIINKKEKTMLKEYLNMHNISIYSISKSSGISYSTLNDIVNCKVEIANVKAGIIHSLAKTLGISMDALFELCKNDIVVRSESYDVYGFVEKKNKKYYLRFEYKNKKYQYEMCPVKREASMFINSIALWEMEKHLLDLKMEDAYALCIKEKG